ncbi:tRNA-binding protein [Mycobacterium vulneris]|uniref:tRNA-binding protein n=1 Tax=Mycolicibacterium vulneris TaxID=547163 RepID=A0A1X2KGP7_9MYCO|nr:tRNA-binding protein [Mycolicibacterium vulneris]OSC18531.1 tRNA-binding protein [Mycolicibacterium vulneris]
MSEQTTIETFLGVGIRVGRVIKAEEFPRANKPAYKLWIDFGDLGIRKSSAQINDLYTTDEVDGRLVLAVVNFPPRQVANFISEVLVGLLHDQVTVSVTRPEGPVWS